MYGGGGIDQFIFNTAPGITNVDQINDFEVNVDKIDFDDDIFTALGPLGALNASRFKIGGSATDASDRIIYNTATGDLFYDKDGTGGAVQVRIAVLDTGLLLDADDFRIIA
jgi:Ca2+-binding RTX toxin-like protein